MSQIKFGKSLGREAWERLKQHRLAMLSLILLIIISSACVTAPLFVSVAPEKQAPWFHTQAPFSVRPRVEAINQWQLGDSYPKHLKDIQIEVFRQDYEDIRLVLRKGLIFRIQKVEGAIPLDSLRINPNEHKVIELLKNDQLGRVMPEMTIHLGEAPPAQLFQPNYQVAFLRVYKSADSTQQYHISLSDGIIDSVRSQNQTIKKLKLRGDEIKSILKNGQPSIYYHFLGTDELGRDLFARILYGGQITLLVGLVATFVSLIIGVFIGAISGYLGGKYDRLIMSGVDILYAIPFMFLVILLLVNFGRSLLMLFFALGAVQWLTMSRIVRTQVMSLKQLAFVDAARLSGASHLQIITNHLLPNCLGNILIYTTLTIPMVIMEESFLSFIGLSVQFNGRSLDSWGTLVHQGMLALGSNGEYGWLLIFPSLTMALTLLSLNILGDGLRDAFDPKLRGKG
jgi:oligopeptide transport system permease protein